MTSKTRVFPTSRRHLAIALLACAALLALASSIVTAGASAAATKPLATESLQAYEQQLAAGQVKATALNVKVRSIHVTLSDGKIGLVHYPSGDEKSVVEAIKAKGITPVSLKGKPISVPKSHKHKIRYIVGGVLVVLIILVGAVLLVRRRRSAAEY
jgi:hypothetical protein